LEEEVCWHERRTPTSAETTPRREPASQTSVCRCVFGQQNAQRRSFKKVVGTVAILRRLPARFREPLAQPNSINSTWSIDFMHYTLMNGRKVRILNIIDDFNREALTINADYSQSGRTVVSALEDLKYWRGRPNDIRCDNGPEFLSNYFVDYCKNQGIQIKYIQPGKPTQNAYIERFNRGYREDVLDAYMFESLNHLRELSAEWQDEYNEFHPHQSLNNLSPNKYLEINT
jgi:putative transposase